MEDYSIDYDVLNMINMHMTGRGKKEKSKKLTRKKSKSRSKMVDDLNTGGKRSKKQKVKGWMKYNKTRR